MCQVFMRMTPESRGLEHCLQLEKVGSESEIHWFLDLVIVMTRKKIQF